MVRTWEALKFTVFGSGLWKMEESKKHDKQRKTQESTLKKSDSNGAYNNFFGFVSISEWDCWALR